MKHISIAFIAVVLLVAPWLVLNHSQTLAYLDKAYSYVNENIANVAAALLHDPITVADLHTAYDAGLQKKVRILIVPGHEPNYGGAEYKDLKEREMTVELGQDLQQFLDQNGHYQTFITRDDNAWSPTFADYFKNNWDAIVAWEKEARTEASNVTYISTSTLKTTITAPETSQVFHNTAPLDVAYRLYGITKWANENNIDIEIHIHFNDNPGHPPTSPGKYSGFAIYVPAAQYDNSSTTKAVATTVFKRLAKYNAVSDLAGESAGIVDEPDLIAIGSNNTADAASMLIEYGYIYEPEFADPTTRSATIKDLAFQTYLGLQDFFGGGNDISMAYDTLVLPHSFDTVLTKTSTSTQDVFALQTALLLDGEYPAPGDSFNNCPRSGIIGPCTLAALSAFQKKYDITGEDGVVGQKTEQVLNDKYSVHAI